METSIYNWGMSFDSLIWCSPAIPTSWHLKVSPLGGSECSKILVDGWTPVQIQVAAWPWTYNSSCRFISKTKHFLGSNSFKTYPNWGPKWIFGWIHMPTLDSSYTWTRQVDINMVFPKCRKTYPVFLFYLEGIVIEANMIWVIYGNMVSYVGKLKVAQIGFLHWNVFCNDSCALDFCASCSGRNVRFTDEKHGLRSWFPVIFSIVGFVFIPKQCWPFHAISCHFMPFHAISCHFMLFGATYRINWWILG